MNPMLQPHPFIPQQEDEPQAMPMMGQLVDLGAPPISPGSDGVTFTPGADGGMVLAGGEFGGDSPLLPGVETAHDDNLAESLQESILATIAQDVIEWVDADLQARKPWHDRLKEGLELLGVVPDVGQKGPFKLAEKVTHPMIAEAAVQFQARAMAELLPPTGPAKGAVLGDATPELEAQAERVADFENYQLMVEDTDFFPETDQMLFVLGCEGSQFKKVYRDPLLRRTVSRWVRGENFIVPYGASSLEQAPRYTHVQPIIHNDLLKLMKVGFYRQAEVATPSQTEHTNTEIGEVKDKAQGQELNDLIDEDVPHTVYECHANYDMPGFEDKDEAGELTGIALPYILTVEKESQKVLAIRRNWEEDDDGKNKIISFVHYPYLPGDGFYSYGLIHLIGGLARGATGLLRIIMIGGAFASMQGGFKTKTGGKTESAVDLEWGVYKPVDATYEELQKGFYTPAFKEPSESLFKVLGLLIEGAQRFSSTTENMVGDANNTGPVGTTVALIEQGSKVYTGIHKRLHYAQGKELKLHAELTGRYIPEEGYPYNVRGASRTIARADFDERIDVIPVSDPNIFSSTQRIAQAQTVVQRSDAKPGLYDAKKVELRFLEAMKVMDPEGLLTKKAKLGRYDPVTENALMMVGKAAKVFVDQDHDSHMTVVQRQIDEMMGRPPGDPIAQRTIPLLVNHLAEHMAIGTRVKMFAAMGLPLPPMNLDAEDDEQITPEAPPQIENLISQRAAQVVQQLPKPQLPGDAQAKQAQEQVKQIQAGLEALKKQAADIEKQRQAAEAAVNDADKARLRAESAGKESTLRSELARLRAQYEHEQGRQVVGNDIKEALLEIERMTDVWKTKMEVAGRVEVAEIGAAKAGLVPSAGQAQDASNTELAAGIKWDGK